MTAREYIDKVMSKTLHDPVLTAQLANGFVLKRLIPGYLTMDVESRGYAAFLEWANVDYVPNPAQRFVPVAPVRVCVVQYQMRHVDGLRGVRASMRVLRRRGGGVPLRLHPVSRRSSPRNCCR